MGAILSVLSRPRYPAHAPEDGVTALESGSVSEGEIPAEHVRLLPELLPRYQNEAPGVVRTSGALGFYGACVDRLSIANTTRSAHNLPPARADASPTLALGIAKPC